MRVWESESVGVWERGRAGHWAEPKCPDAVLFISPVSFIASQSPGYEVALQAKLYELIVYLSRAYMETDTAEAHALLRVGNVIGALESGFSRDWQLDELLAIANMSRSNMMLVFSHAAGRCQLNILFD